MPYLKVSLSCPVTVDDEKKLHKDILEITHRTLTEKPPMMEFSGGHRFWYRNCSPEGAYVELHLIDRYTLEQQEAFIKEICDYLGDNYPIPKSEIVVNIIVLPIWGKGGETLKA